MVFVMILAGLLSVAGIIGAIVIFHLGDKLDTVLSDLRIVKEDLKTLEGEVDARFEALPKITTK